MDQQSNYQKAGILDLSVHQSSDSLANLSRDQKKKQKLVGKMSEEELKIRSELESEIERNLEEEIKEGIYHLALRLHRLYQHQKERKAGEALDSGDKNSEALSEVNISIRMEGRAKIEIKETEKEAPDRKGHQQGGRPRSSRSEDLQATSGFSNKKFDWAKSLRCAGTDPVANLNKKNRRYSLISQNHHVDNAAREIGSASGHRRRSVGGSNKVLEQPWKYLN